MVYEVLIPEGVQIDISGNDISVKGKLGEVKKTFDFNKIKITKEDKKLVLEPKSKLRKHKAYTGTITAHINNLVKGVNEGHQYKLKILYAHFPVNVSVNGNRVVIKNFVGEKSPRYANIVSNTKVEVKGHEIFVTGIDIEEVGQTAANIEQATRIKKRDLRVFGDGIFIVSKAQAIEAKSEGK